jgi:outer membrane lipoprotein SlyB
MCRRHRGFFPDTGGGHFQEKEQIMSMSSQSAMDIQAGPSPGSTDGPREARPPGARNLVLGGSVLALAAAALGAGIAVTTSQVQQADAGASQVPAATIAPAPARAANTQVFQAPARSEPARVVATAPPCAGCGVVQSVSVSTQARQTSGIGAVSGGVVGGLLGNQMGKGDGRTAMTVLGAVGGGVAGNAIEKNMNRQTVYHVQVRLDDGSTRTIRQASSVAVGTRVVVDGQTLRLANGTASG